MFQSIMEQVFNSCIPKKHVIMSQRDKPWISPHIKILIHERWAAFRNRNWQLFNHLKVKIKAEIVNAKRRWLDKIKSKNIWKAFKLASNGNLSHPLDSILSLFENVSSAAEGINESLVSNFIPSKPPPCIRLLHVKTGTFVVSHFKFKKLFLTFHDTRLQLIPPL